VEAKEPAPALLKHKTPKAKATHELAVSAGVTNHSAEMEALKKSALAAAMAEAAGVKPVDKETDARKQGTLLKQGTHWFALVM
jgi:hypothetical protein